MKVSTYKELKVIALSLVKERKPSATETQQEKIANFAIDSILRDQAFMRNEDFSMPVSKSLRSLVGDKQALRVRALTEVVNALV
jgi:hypothetical protein